MTNCDRVNKHFRILDYAPSSIFIINKDFKVLFWNKCIVKWTGILPSEIEGKDIRTYYKHLSKPAYQSRIEVIFSGGPPAVFSSQLHSQLIPCRLPSGAPRVQKTVVTPVPSESEDELCALFSIEDVSALSTRINDFKKMRDTALKEVKQREIAEEELTLQNNVLNSVLSASPVGIVLIENNEIQWGNSAFQDIFNVKEEAEYKGHTTEEFYATTDEYIRVGKEIIAKAQGTKMIELDAEFKRKDETFTGHIMMSCLDDKDYFKKIIVTVFDLTSRIKSENDKIQKEKLQGVLEMAGAVCHEMNQPIMAITGYSELLMCSLSEDDSSYDKIKKIYTQSQRTGEITRRLMNLTKYETVDYADGEKILDIAPHPVSSESSSDKPV